MDCHLNTCSLCNADEIGDNHWYELPCDHKFCAPCFSGIIANRGCNPFHQCPVKNCSNCRSSSWNLCSCEYQSRQTRSGTSRKRFVHINRQSFHLREPKIDSEPKQYHQSLDDAMLRNTWTLSLTFPRVLETNGRVTLHCISAELNGSDADEHWSEQAKERVEAIFQFLHCQLVSKDNSNTAKSHGSSRDDFFGCNEETFDDVAKDDSTSTLHRCIYALGMGRQTSSQENDTARWTKLSCEAFAASEIIRNLSGIGKRGTLRNKVAGQLISCGASKALWKIFSRLGVAPSEEFARLGEKKNADDKIAKGFTTDPHDLVAILYDNIGFRKKGSTPGYEQFTAIQLVRIPKLDLQSWGIYPDPGDPCKKLLSRERKKWNEIRQDTSYEQIMGVTDDENDLFAQTILKPIKVLLKIEAEGGLPSTDEARELVADFENRKNTSYSTKSFQEMGVRNAMEGDKNTSHVVTSISNVKEVNEKEQHKTALDANNAIVDRPLKMDLNAKETVICLMDYGLTLREKVINSPPENEWWAGIDKILDSYELPLLGDGSPTYAISTALRSDKEAKYGGKVRAFGGGFHLLLEAHRKRGSIFGPTHLADIFSSWRTSQGQLDWVLDPGDPNQIDAELVMYVLAMYTAAIRSEAARRAKIAKSEGQDNFEMSPGDIIDAMVKRALEEPLVMIILCELRLAELTFMLHEAEKNGSAEIYIAAKKYLTILFACTHATKYVSMSFDFFVDLFCFSEADRVIFEKAIFTRKTKNGKRIFSDRFVEWMMKDLRSWLGKMASPHIDSLLERCALNLNSRKKQRAVGRKELKVEGSVSSSTEQALQLDHVYFEVLIFAEEANIFGDGPLRHIQRGPSSRRKDMGVNPYEKDELTPICCLAARERFEKPLNKEMLSLIRTGRSRCQAYFDTYYKKGDLNDPRRSEKDVDLTSIDPNMSTSDRQDKRDLERVTSIEFKTVAKLYTIPELKNEIKYLNQQIIQTMEGRSEDQRSSFESSSLTGKKDQLVTKVVLLRYKLIELNPNWPSERNQAIHQIMEERQNATDGSMRETMEKELEDVFYTLNGSNAKEESARKDRVTFPASRYDNFCVNGDDGSGNVTDEEVTGLCYDDDEGDDSHARSNPPMRPSEGFRSVLGSDFNF